MVKTPHGDPAAPPKTEALGESSDSGRLSEPPHIGILGAGRLATAVARRWHLALGIQPPLWSRRFQAAGSLTTLEAEEKAFSVASIKSVMGMNAVFAAIPGNAVMELAARHQAIRDYEGVLFLAGIDRPIEMLQRVLPAALVVRVAPFLLPSREDVPCLVLQPDDRGPRWESCAKVVLSVLGPSDLVDDEKVFEIVLQFGSPFPVVLRKALRNAVATVLSKQGIHAEWEPLAERVLWQALSATKLVPGPAGSDASELDVATPGGITERGLQEAGQLSQSMVDVMSAMICHAEQLRANETLREASKGRDDKRA
jgi:pyrroline-5-carboxylate reductase